MAEQSRLDEVIKLVLAASKAEQTEVLLISRDMVVTRFANNYIHQNTAVNEATLSVRAIVGKKTGLASTNELSASAVHRAVQRATDMARLGPDDPTFSSLPHPQVYRKVQAFHQRTANYAPEQQASDARTICTAAARHNLTAAGVSIITALQIAVANSFGLRAVTSRTSASLGSVISSSTASGYADAVSTRIEQINAEAIADEAIEKARRGADPRPVPPGEYEVILEENAVGDILEYLGVLGLGGRSVQEGSSFMCGRFGEQVLGDNITVRDDGLDPGGVPEPFDYEGVSKRRVDCIVRGIARAVCYDTATAAREGKTSTGHALPPGSGWGPVPTNLFLEPGNATKQEMIASTRRGLLVTRFHYTRPVHPAMVVVTGMTRDGTFLIENGRITHPVKNLRFTQSYVEALNNVEMVGKAVRLTHPGFVFSMVPALKINRFSFTGVTAF